MRAICSRWAWVLVFLGCRQETECRPGVMRGCETDTVDAGFTQDGYQVCEASGSWSSCVPVGVCAGDAGASRGLYARCEESSQCGPAQCAVCGHYTGVQNPNAYGVCHPYCQVDADCVPTSEASDVTARCVLGQCSLFCRSVSRCPHDSQCLPWNNPDLSAAYPGYDGLCE